MKDIYTDYIMVSFFVDFVDAAWGCVYYQKCVSKMLSLKGFIPFDDNMVINDPSGSTPMWALLGKASM